MPLKTTNSFIKSLKDFFTGTTNNALSNSVPVARWQAPEELISGIFEDNAALLYQKEISKPKREQNLDKLITKGNDYYFALSVKKSHRLFTRSRIENVSVAKSLEKGFSGNDGFLETKYKLIGDVVDPNDTIPKGV